MKTPLFRRCVLIWVLGAVLGGSTIRAESTWRPDHTWVFAVGLAHFSSRGLSFYGDPRPDVPLVQLFRHKGVPESHIVFLKDRQCTLANIRKSWAAQWPKAQRGDLLVFYYTGHGGGGSGLGDQAEGYYLTYWPKQTLRVIEIASALERYFRGSQVLVISDTCDASTLEQQILHHGKRLSYAFLMSSQANETSFDWTFTKLVLEGLQGSCCADLNHDGRVTLEELGRFVVSNTALLLHQFALFQNAGFDPDMRIADAAPKNSPRECECVRVFVDNGWWNAKILAEDGRRVKVHYEAWGYDTKRFDQWVDEKSVRRLTMPHYRVGSLVQAKWEGQWYPGKIIEVRDGVPKVHFTGYSKEFDFWTSGQDQLRLTYR